MTVAWDVPDGEQGYFLDYEQQYDSFKPESFSIGKEVSLVFPGFSFFIEKMANSFPFDSETVQETVTTFIAYEGIFIGIETIPLSPFVKQLVG